ncbi:hypothetical protein EV127DRAFT_412177 [Xylaria flabelliformis]|nr:hypothetical protein EV127DRAFT_412177 [Xylaria flabelliformis]
MLSIIPLLALFLLTLVCVAAKKYRVQWTSALQNWFDYYCPHCIPTSVDLWVTDSSNHKYHKIASWTATVPAAELSNFSTWILQFVPNGEDPSLISEQVSSCLFIINHPDAPSSSGGSISSPTPSSTMPVSTNSTTITPLPNSGLTTGARAGIGAGIGAGAIVVFTLGWCLARYHGKKSKIFAIGGTRTQNMRPEVHVTASQTAYQDPPAYTSRGHAPMSVNVNDIRVSHNSIVEMI